MTGIKGRSGKSTTAHAKRALAAAGRKSAASKKSTPALPPSTATDPLSDDPVKRLGRPLTWGDELKQAQVDGERTQNRRRAVEVERAQVELDNAKREAREAAGRLVERAELDRTAALIRDAWWREVQRVTSDTLAALPGLPVEARALIKSATDAAIVAAAERVKVSAEARR